MKYLREYWLLICVFIFGCLIGNSNIVLKVIAGIIGATIQYLNPVSPIVPIIT